MNYHIHNIRLNTWHSHRTYQVSPTLINIKSGNKCLPTPLKQIWHYLNIFYCNINRTDTTEGYTGQILLKGTQDNNIYSTVGYTG